MSSTSSAVSDAGSSPRGDAGIHQSQDAQRKMSVGAIIGLVVGILGSLVLLAVILLIVQWIKRRKRLRRSTRPASRDSSSTGDDAQRPLTTQVGPGSNLQLVNGRLERITDGSAATRYSSNNNRETGTARGGGRRPYRYNQRQDSGRSIRSVPAYNDEAGEDEVVLMKPRPSTDELSRMSTTEEHLGASTSTAPLMSGSPLSVQPSMFEQNNYSTSSMPLVGDRSGEGEDPPLYVARTPELPPASLTQTPSRLSLALTPSSTIGFDEISLAETGESHAVRPSTDSSASRLLLGSRFGHRPTLSADAASTRSASSFADHRLRSKFKNGKGPSVKGNRARSATTGSRMSLPRPSSFIRGNSSMSGSVGADSDANASSSSLVISAPIRDTLVSSANNYVYPKNGLSPAQMSFLSSRESLALVGVQTENQPPSFDLARSTSRQEDQGRTSADETASSQDATVTIPQLPPGAEVHETNSPDGVFSDLPTLPTPAIVVDTSSRNASPAPSPSVAPAANPLDHHAPPVSASSQRETLDDQLIRHQQAELSQGQ